MEKGYEKNCGKSHKYEFSHGEDHKEIVQINNKAWTGKWLLSNPHNTITSLEVFM